MNVLTNNYGVYILSLWSQEVLAWIGKHHLVSKECIFTSSAAGVAPVDMMQKFYFYAVSEISQIWQQNLELDGQFDHREVILAILHCNAVTPI